MPNYPVHVLAQFGGRIVAAGHPNEIWSCGIRLQEFTSNTWQAYADEIGPALAAYFALGTNLMATSAYLDYLKVNPIGPDGDYVDKANTNEWTSSGSVHGAAAPTAPSFCSVAFSWVTGRARGLASKGRIYPPNFTAPLSGGAFAADSTMGGIAAAAVRLLQVFQNESGNSQLATPIVASGVDGHFNDIIGVRVGNVFDVQRRRKNAYPETYTAADLPNAPTGGGPTAPPAGG